MSALTPQDDDWMVNYFDDLLVDEDQSADADESQADTSERESVAGERVSVTDQVEAVACAAQAEGSPAAPVTEFLAKHSTAPATITRTPEPSEPSPLKPAPEPRFEQTPDSLPSKVPHSSSQVISADPEVRKQQLQKLLHESTLKSAIKPAVKSAPVQPANKIDTTPKSPAKTEPEPAGTVATKAQVIADGQVKKTTQQQKEAVQLQETDVQPEAQLELQEWQNGRPPWAQDRFDVLLFSVSNLTLAVPLIALGQIQKLSDELTPLFGQSKWFMGLLPTATSKIRCVDTALFVMPDRYKSEFRDNYRFVITIDGLPWGLAVDEVKQPIQLAPDEVNWRGSRSQRPWLAGTIKEHMCALLDVPELGRILAEQDKSKS